MATTSVKRRAFSVGGLIVAIVLFVAVNVLAGTTLRGTRVDLTADGLYTLSDGTRSVVSQLEDVITLRYFVSDRLVREVPQYGQYGDRVRELLEEYVIASDGLVRLEVYNPQPYSDEEDRAVALGLQGVPLDAGGESVYFGLAATNSTGTHDVLPFLQPNRERFLEYDLTKLIYNLAYPDKKTLAYLSELPIAADMMTADPAQPNIPRPWVIMEQLRQLFDTRAMTAVSTEVPADTDVLMVVHPQTVREHTLYEIDQYVMNGGRAIVFVDPHSESGSMRNVASGLPAAASASQLERLMEAWGVEMVHGKFAADRDSARRVAAGEGARVQGVDYVAWLHLTGDRLNRDDPVTAELESLRLRSAGVLQPLDGATTRFEPLVTTSPNAAPMDSSDLIFDPDPVRLLNAFEPRGQRLVMAARVTGPARSAFPDGPPVDPARPVAAPAAAEGEQAGGEQAEGEQAEGEQAEGEQAGTEGPAAPPARRHLERSAGDINVIIVADTDLLENESWIQMQNFFGQRVSMPVAGNASFVINAIENLTGSSELIGLRSRGGSQRPFVVVDELRRTAEAQFRAKEEELIQRLRTAEERLRELQSGAAEGDAILTAQQEAAIDSFREEALAIRRELRGVQFELRRDIEALEDRVKFVNIGLVPLLVALAAGVLAVLRARRRRRRAGRAA